MPGKLFGNRAVGDACTDTKVVRIYTALKRTNVLGVVSLKALRVQTATIPLAVRSVCIVFAVHVRAAHQWVKLGRWSALCRGLYCDGENGRPGRCRSYNAERVGSGATCDINAGPLCQTGLSCIVEVEGFSAVFRCRPRVMKGHLCTRFARPLW